MDTQQPEGRIYEPPRLEILGAVESLTQVQDKKLGVTDGFSFMGSSITNASA